MKYFFLFLCLVAVGCGDYPAPKVPLSVISSPEEDYILTLKLDSYPFKIYELEKKTEPTFKKTMILTHGSRTTILGN